MCGIAGFCGKPAWDNPPQLVLQRMPAAINHRGPDDSGIYLEGPVGLGHVRLSIIDLAGGTQPMADVCLRLDLHQPVLTKCRYLPGATHNAAETTPRASKSDAGGLGEVYASSRAPTGRAHGEVP